MIKKIFFGVSVFIYIFCSSAFAQSPQVIVAYINSAELIDAVPEKLAASQKLLSLSDSYKEELKLLQNEYNKKYSDYITYQGSLAENIKLRRMQELTTLENQMQQFVELAQKDIEEQEDIMLEPIKKRISDVVREIGIEQNYTVIYDVSDPAIAFITPGAVNATPLVKARLGTR